MDRADALYRWPDESKDMAFGGVGTRRSGCRGTTDRGRLGAQADGLRRVILPLPFDP
jgi:hypothetical protein